MNHYVFMGLNHETQESVKAGGSEYAKSTALIHKICNFLGQNYYEIIGRSHKRKFADVRKIVIHQLKTSFPRMKITAIARTLNRDHTTILYTLDQYDDQYKTNPEFKELAQRVDKFIHSNK